MSEKATEKEIIGEIILDPEIGRRVEKFVKTKVQVKKGRMTYEIPETHMVEQTDFGMGVVVEVWKFIEGNLVKYSVAFKSLFEVEKELFLSQEISVSILAELFVGVHQWFQKLGLECTESILDEKTGHVLLIYKKKNGTGHSKVLDEMEPDPTKILQ